MLYFPVLQAELIIKHYLLSGCQLHDKSIIEMIKIISIASPEPGDLQIINDDFVSLKLESQN